MLTARYICLTPFDGLIPEIIEKTLSDVFIFRTMNHYAKLPSTASYYAKNYLDHLDLYNFDEDGNLWIHIAVAEQACEALGNKDLVTTSIEGILLKLEEDVREANAKLRIVDHDAYLQLIVRSCVLQDLTTSITMSRKRRSIWIDKVLQSKEDDPRRERLQKFQDDYEILNILVNVIGIEQFLTGIDAREFDLC